MQTPHPISTIRFSSASPLIVATSATCGNTACKTAISSIDDSTLSLIKTGLTACGNLPDSDTTGLKSAAVYATYVNYQYLSSIATQCGHPARTVKLTPHMWQRGVQGGHHLHRRQAHSGHMWQRGMQGGRHLNRRQHIVLDKDRLHGRSLRIC
jgi:hypothetical protein